MMTRIDEETGVVTSIKPATTSYLLRTYGKTSNQSLNESLQEKINHVYVHIYPIANLFNNTRKYDVMAKGQGTPKTNTQLIRIGKIIITNAGIFS